MKEKRQMKALKYSQAYSNFIIWFDYIFYSFHIAKHTP